MISVPTAVALAFAISQHTQPERNMECFRRPPHAELAAIYDEAHAFAPVASEWAGYEIPWLLAWVLAQRETNHINSCDNCRGGGEENPRPGGYFGIGAVAARKWGAGLGFSWIETRAPRAQKEELCLWLVDHPRAQVRILFRMAAYYLRANGGNLYALFSIWKNGNAAGCDYATECRLIWLKRWPWPKDGKLRRL